MSVESHVACGWDGWLDVGVGRMGAVGVGGCVVASIMLGYLFGFALSVSLMVVNLVMEVWW